mmetsp:Transcript_24136/g.56031  ORF Transcript_24136/g.56031 Transcript_24136/m.56031 type:complete len:203 (-) Transcript_24136:371-979(-)
MMSASSEAYNDEGHVNGNCAARTSGLCHQCVDEGTGRLDGFWPDTWCAGRPQAGEWLQATFTEQMVITQIETQGRYPGDQWGAVESYEFTFDGSEGAMPPPANTAGVFSHSTWTSSSQKTTRVLAAPAIGRRFRFVVNSYGHWPSMAFELHGLPASCTPPTLPPSPPPAQPLPTPSPSPPPLPNQRVLIRFVAVLHRAVNSA